MMGNTANSSDAQAMCKADKGWLAMPKTSDDMADIKVYDREKHTIIKSLCLLKNK